MRFYFAKDFDAQVFVSGDGLTDALFALDVEQVQFKRASALVNNAETVHW